jgi:phospholipid/cholesterol/gamma-HCH transport system permease protein
LITGISKVIVAWVKAALFGMAAGLIACYKGISVGGGPAGVGNAVNETVVYTFVSLFAINIIVTAVSVSTVGAGG